MAPKLIKLASMSRRYIMESVKRSDSGITDATIKPERQLPNSSRTTKITIKLPKTKFSVMVKVVFPTNSLRSKNPLMYNPSGRILDISCTR